MTKDTMPEDKDVNLDEGLELAKKMNVWLDHNPKFYLNKSGRKVRILSTVEHG